jgi:predicted alpha/beta hydrolase
MAENRIIAGDWPLAAFVHEPAGEPRAVVVLAHAMMAHSRYLTPLADALAETGVCVWRIDFRGHGESQPHPPEGDWTYDDLVAGDHPAISAVVRAAHADKPVWLIGHSLGGHTAVAAQGVEPGLYDGIIGVSCGLWGFETSTWLRLMRRTIMELSWLIVRALGRVPMRALGVGPDESRGYWRQTLGFCRSGRWLSDDGHDYQATARTITIPCYTLRGTEDRVVDPNATRAVFSMPHAVHTEAPDENHFSLATQGLERIVALLLRALDEHHPVRRG